MLEEKSNISNLESPREQCNRSLQKILIVSLRGPSHAARRGGAQEYIHRVAASWVKRGCDVEILCRQERDPQSKAWLPEEEVIDGIQITRVGKGWLGLWQLVRESRRRSASADCIIENLMTVPLLTPLITRSNQQPKFAIKHHFLTRAMIRSMPWHKSLILGFFENLVLPVVYRRTRLVVNSEHTGNAASRRWRRWGALADLHVVPCGFQHLESGVEKTDYPSVFFVGHINIMRKRVDHLIEAFAVATKDLPNARLRIGGDGPDIERLRDLCLQKCAGKVEFLGFLSEEEKHREYARAWVFASPSYAEGFGITWVEAGAHGTPLLAYDLGLDTVNENCATLVPPGDVDALSESLGRLLKDRTLLEEMGNAAKENSKRFDWDNSSSLFWDLLCSASSVRACN